MHFLFRTQATHSTAERRLLAFADAGAAPERPEDAEKNDIAAKREQLRGFITAGDATTMRQNLHTEVTRIVGAQDPNVNIVETCKKTIIDTVKQQQVWKDLPNEKKVAIRLAFPRDYREFLDFVVKAEILDDEVADRELQKFKNLRPAHMNFDTGVTQAPENSVLTQLRAKREDVLKRMRANESAASKRIRGRSPINTIEARGALNEELKAVDSELAALLGPNWSVILKGMDHQTALDRRARILEKERLGREYDEARGIRRGRIVLEDNEEIVGGVRRLKPRPRADITPAMREANLMREGDFDISQVPTYEYRVPSTFKASPRRGADGKMHDVDMDEWMSYQPGTDGRTVSGESNNNHPRRKKTLSVPSLFGGTISDAAYNKAKGRPVFDQNGPNGNRALNRRYEGARLAEADKLYTELYKKYSKAEIEGSLSYNQLELLMNKAVDPDERLQHSKDLIQVLKTIDRQLSSVNSLKNETAVETIPDKTTSISFAMNFQEDRPEHIQEEVMVTDPVHKKSYHFRPQFLHDTTKGAADIKAIKEMAKAGIVVQIDRNGVNIPYSTMKYVSGITIGLAKNTVGYISVERSNNKEVTKEKTIENIPSIPFTLPFAQPGETAKTAADEGYVAPEAPSQTVLKVPSNEKIPYITEAKAKEHMERRNALLKKVDELDDAGFGNVHAKAWFKQALSFDIGKAGDNEFFLLYKGSASSMELLVDDAKKSQVISGFINNPADPSNDYKNICNILKTPKGALDGLEKNIDERLKYQKKDNEQKEFDELIARFEKVQTAEEFDAFKKALSEAKDTLIQKAHNTDVSQEKIDAFIKDFDDRALPFQPGNPIIQKPHPGHGRKFNAWTLEQLLKTMKVHNDIFDQHGAPEAPKGVPLGPTDA